MSSTITASPGARRPASGTVGAALRHRSFRVMWLGMFASNIGTWMQTVVLPAYIDVRTHSGFWVGMFTFATLGPLLLLSIPGGVIADLMPRKPWMAFLQSEQMILSLVVAWFVAKDASLIAIFLAQLAIGIGNAFNAPATQGVVPNLVPKEDLAGAVSLNSVMINGSRVIGPVIAALLMSRGVSTADIFVINAVTYLFVIAAIVMIVIPPIGRASEARGIEGLLTGVRIARRRSIIGRILLSLSMFSIVSLAFVGLFPTICRLDFHLNPRSGTYKWLYATWGLGASLGALAIGTVLAHVDKRKLVMPLFVGFALSLGVFALLRSAALAFPVGFLLGAFYFALATAMSTIVQQNLLAAERARVMSLWFMAFGGSVSIGNLVFGPVMDRIGARPVLLIGAGFALLLAWWCDVARRHVTTIDDDPTVPPSALGYVVHRRDQAGDHPLQAGGAARLDEHGITAGE